MVDVSIPGPAKMSATPGRRPGAKMPQAKNAEDREQVPVTAQRMRGIASLSMLALGGMANMLWLALLAWLVGSLIYSVVVDYL